MDQQTSKQRKKIDFNHSQYKNKHFRQGYKLEEKSRPGPCQRYVLVEKGQFDRVMRATGTFFRCRLGPTHQI